MNGAPSASKKARSISRHSAAPQMPVRRVLAFRITAPRLGEVGGPVDVDVHDALEMREDRHPRLGLHPADQPLAAARHDHVDEARSSSASRRPRRGRWSAPAGSPPPAARPPRSPATSPAWIACAERRLSEPPRRIAALPAFRQSAPASAVTFGRLSKITPITPIGVRTRRMCSPDGRSHSAITCADRIGLRRRSRAAPRPCRRPAPRSSSSRSSIAPAEPLRPARPPCRRRSPRGAPRASSQIASAAARSAASFCADGRDRRARPPPPSRSRADLLHQRADVDALTSIVVPPSERQVVPVHQRRPALVAEQLRRSGPSGGP